MAYTLIVDRIEAGFAVCEDKGGTSAHVALSELPRDVREGDCLRKDDGCYIIDVEETARRKAAIKALFDRLKEPD